ncbi:hypothetical protein IRZ71_18770 [Flavobacterium sp. ANB]|uniref:hypothetical protein n=1 Tax=unclassified Flavobacterium TaxID=196869 RepID=UPI0012B84374|nr:MULTISPECIES: hypothetical protein [unclassified Flavobacterium]MBF4518404.1 hypothetical protein [Flavobacterium sp. ANB]MTD70902.1 hypothetical protein [Flavobacterium sp. LC2016-13]
MIKKTSLLISLVLLLSCERECKLSPIPTNIFQLEDLKQYYLFHSKNDTVNAKITDKYDYYEKTSFKSPTKIRRCEHYKSYELDFKGEKILVSVRKNVPDSLELDVFAFGNCTKFPSEKKIIQKELLQNKYYTFERESDCDSSNSIVKKVILKGYLITSITTSDNKIWTIK